MLLLLSQGSHTSEYLPTMASPREMSSIEKSEGNHNVLKLDSLPVINCEVTKTAEEHPSIAPVG